MKIQLQMRFINARESPKKKIYLFMFAHSKSISLFSEFVKKFNEN